MTKVCNENCNRKIRLNVNFTGKVNHMVLTPVIQIGSILIFRFGGKWEKNEQAEAELGQALYKICLLGKLCYPPARLST